jgi:hypothetical protein
LPQIDVLHVVIQAPLDRQEFIAPETFGNVGRIAQEIVDQSLVHFERGRFRYVRHASGWTQSNGQLIFVKQHAATGVQLGRQRRRGYDLLEQTDWPESEINLESISILRYITALFDPEDRIGINRIPIDNECLAEIVQPRMIGHNRMDVLHNQDDVVIG